MSTTPPDSRADELQKQITDLQTQRQAAEDARMKRFQAKLAKSAVRHAILGFCAPFIGSAIAVAWDAFDLVDLASMVADLDDQITVLQDQVDALDVSPDLSDASDVAVVDSTSPVSSTTTGTGGGGGGIHFGCSADTPLTDGTTGTTLDSGRVLDSQGSEVSKWDREHY